MSRMFSKKKLNLLGDWVLLWECQVVPWSVIVTKARESGKTELGERISRRAEALGKSIKSLEREIGVADCYISDVIGGRKQSVRASVIGNLASALKTTQTWLLRGIGPESVKPAPTAKIADLGKDCIAVGPFSHIEASRQAEIVITGLDMGTRQCAFMLDDQRLRGAIVDPSIRMPGNVYAASMMRIEPILVLMKDAITESGERISFIIDAPGAPTNGK
jgi:transcriptional regulator with XRE-family HTH domain